MGNLMIKNDVHFKRRQHKIFIQLQLWELHIPQVTTKVSPPPLFQRSLKKKSITSPWLMGCPLWKRKCYRRLSGKKFECKLRLHEHRSYVLGAETHLYIQKPTKKEVICAPQERKKRQNKKNERYNEMCTTLA